MQNNLFHDQIPLLKPWLGKEEVEAAEEVILSGWISQGQKVIEFENAVAHYVGAKYAVATNSCTSSLHLALQLSGIRSDDQVICPSFTCMATANAIHHTGAIPYFAEIDPKTYNLSPEAVEESITLKTKAILLVHQIGLPADRDTFVEIAKKYDLVLIEDAACSFGATYKGKKVGGLGSPTAFSFHPRKMITTGEGGMITTNDSDLVEKARMLRATGASISDLERHKAKGVLVQKYEQVGYNYRMTDIQAAIGLVQMKKIEAMLEQRNKQAHIYNQALAEIEEIDPPFVPDYATHAYSSYLICLNSKAKISRDELLQKMANKGISCRVGIQPLHLEPFYKDSYRENQFYISEKAAARTMFLPIFPGLTGSEQSYIIQVLKQSLI